MANVRLYHTHNIKINMKTFSPNPILVESHQIITTRFTSSVLQFIQGHSIICEGKSA